MGGNNHVLVLVELMIRMEPLDTNSRVNAKELFDKNLEEPWFMDMYIYCGRIMKLKEMKAGSILL